MILRTAHRHLGKGDVIHARFRLRTLLLGVTAVAMAGGAVRGWYGSHQASQRRDAAIVDELRANHVSAQWAYHGPQMFGIKKLLASRTAFQRVSHLWCDDADLQEVAPRMNELDELQSIFVLGRQVIEGAAASGGSHSKPVVRLLSQHPSLRRIVVDATSRATPHYDSPPYSRDDLTMLQESLPAIEIIWQEVN